MKYLKLFEAYSDNYVYLKDVSQRPHKSNELWNYISNTEFDETVYKKSKLNVEDIYNEYNDGSIEELDGILRKQNEPVPFGLEDIEKNKVFIIHSKDKKFFNDDFYIILLNDSHINEIDVVDISDYKKKEPRVYQLDDDKYEVIINNRQYHVWKKDKKFTNKRIGFVKNSYIPRGKQIHRVKVAKQDKDWSVINLFTYIDNALVPPKSPHLKQQVNMKHIKEYNEYRKDITSTKFKTMGEKYDGFCEYISSKMNIDISNNTYLGSGCYGEVYDIGKDRVIKFTSSGKESTQHKIMNKNIKGIAKIYSTGTIKLPSRFVSRNNIRNYLYLKDTSIFVGYGKNNYEIGYVILEKLNTKGVSDIIELYAKIPIEVWLKNDEKGEYYADKLYTKYEYISGLNALSDYNKDDTFYNAIIEYINGDYFGNQDDKNISIEIIKELSEIFNEVKKYYNWQDIHSGQFGKDKNDNIKVYDLDSHQGDDCIHNPKNIIREKKSI